MEAGYYTALLRHPDPAARVGWRTRLGQATRYEAAIALVEPGDTVLDLGCGLADLYPYLRDTGRAVGYIGVDADPAMVSAAQARHPDAAIHRADYRTDALPTADVVVAVGALVSGDSLRDDATRRRALVTLATSAFTAARRLTALVVLRQEVIVERAAMRAESALGGALETEVATLAEAVGASQTDALDVLATDRVIYLGRRRFTRPAGDFAKRAVAGPHAAGVGPVALGRFWLAAGDPERAHDAVADVDLGASAEGRWLRDALAFAAVSGS